MGVPISAMMPITTLNSTDNFVISQGPVLGDNKRIEYQDLLSLLTSAIQNFGQSVSIVQTAVYTNNNVAANVVTSFNILLTSGKWDIFFDGSLSSGGVASDFSYYISYNTNPLIVNQDASDVVLSASGRSVKYPASGGISISSMGASLVVPSSQTYIIKLAVYDASGNTYSINNRVLKAIKTI
jgi:hypothetical protein